MPSETVSREKPKPVNIERVLSSVPDLAQLRPQCEGGVLSGCIFTVNWDGSWETRTSARVKLAEVARGDVLLHSSLGPLTLKKSLATQWLFGEGILRGIAIAVGLQVSSPRPAKVLRRSYLRVREDLSSRFTFPKAIEDPETHEWARTWLPLSGPWGMLDVYFLKQGPYLILETLDLNLDDRQFLERCGAARMLLSYLGGQRIDGASCDVIANGEDETVVEATWFPGNDHKNHIYACIPCSWGEWVGAQKALGLPMAVSPMDPSKISTCFTKLMEVPDLTVPIQYLLAFPDAPVEMRGALLAVALEALTDVLKSQRLLEFSRPLSDEQWDPLKKGLTAVLNAQASAWPKGKAQEQAKIIQSRIENLNSPTNRDKLSLPFKVLGIDITEAELSAISERDTLLHSGRLIPRDERRVNPEAWREAYVMEMRLFTAINKLLLRYLGYRGPLIDWGERGLTQVAAYTSV
jgi:hypothetical protein